MPIAFQDRTMSNMARVRVQVRSACRDCELCTGTAFTGLGRSAARGTANLVSLGLVGALMRKCDACGHPMVEHGGQNGELVNVQRRERSETNVSSDAIQPRSAPSRLVGRLPASAGWHAHGGTWRWFDGAQWTAHRAPGPPSSKPISPPSDQVVSSPAVRDLAEQLRTFAELRDEGLISSDDYEAKKRQLLGM
ncbi:SHOCT domain-containing protein [Agrococcus sp. KRD186]|uniref:SHOCT domain-containing protein n=1 Tax=Agrococcus sp. KRD186 TaxID=2729730 RepID=UPI00406D4A50